MAVGAQWGSRDRTASSNDDDVTLVDLPVDHDDLAIVARSQIDPREFGPLYERYAPVVYYYCLRRLSNPDAAADATALVFTRTLAALPRFRSDRRREGETFRAWLFTIAHNVIVDHHRRHRTHVSLDTQPVPPAQAHRLIDASATPERQVLLNDAAERVQRLLSTLPERPRAIVELRLAGLTGQEIAETLGMSHAAVKSAQRRAYASLREAVLDHPHDDVTPETSG
jgi:RNA polymerase sigma-70 factor (ECF subfamily)